jgi:hypothetical protein
MATKVLYLPFYIVLTDPDQVAAIQSTPAYLAAGGINRAPYDPGPPAGGAAIEFSAPFKGFQQLTADAAPYIWTPFSGAGSQGGPYPLDVATFQRHTGGFLGIGGTTTRYYWLGQVVYAGTAANPPGGTGDEANAPDLEFAPNSLARFVEGFEVVGGGIGSGGTFGAAATALYSADAGQCIGSYGLALRGASGSSLSAAPSIYRAITPSDAWERMYIRLRKLPVGQVSFWSCIGTPTSSNGLSLEVNGTGNLCIVHTNTGGRSTLATIDPPLPVWTGRSDEDAWRRLDLIIEYNNGNANGRVRLWIDGELVFSQDIATADGGLGSGTRVQATRIGEAYSFGSNRLEIDVDHWISKDIPAGQARNGTNGANRPYLYDASSSSYIAGDLVHTPDGHVYKAIAGVAAGVEPSPRHNGTSWHRYEQRDWLNGTRILLAKSNAFGAGNVWAGDHRVTQQRMMGATNANAATLTNAVSGAVCEVIADVPENLETEPGMVGCGAVQVTGNTSRGATASNGKLGYNVNGAGAVDTTVTEGTSLAYKSVLYPGGGLAALDDLSPLLLRYTHNATTDTCTLNSLVAMIEVLGCFCRADFRPNPEGGVYSSSRSYYAGDVVARKHFWYTALASTTPLVDATHAATAPDPADPGSSDRWALMDLPEFPRFVGQHNFPYRRCPNVLGAGAAPVSPVIFHAGTYTGNGTAQDLTFRAPVNCLFIRALTSPAGISVWYPPMLGLHRVAEQRVTPLVVTQEEDPTFVEVDGDDAQQTRYRIRIIGGNSQVNQNTIVYQYLAIMDPGQRFMLNGALVHDTNLALDADNNFIDAAFTPEWAFIMFEGSDGTTTIRLCAKGPGSAANDMQTWAANNVASSLAFGAGKLTTKSAFHGLSGTLGAAVYSAWRRSDGNDDPGEPGVVAIGSYVGDGSASRSISIAPVSGKRPLFAMVFNNGTSAGYMRDPSHTTTTSTQSGGTTDSNGITGGAVDGFSVGSNLNGNGIIYNWIVWFASSTAGNGGWGTNGEYIPVEANAPVGDTYPDDPDEQDVIDSQDDDDEEEPAPPAEEPDLDNETPLPGTDFFCLHFSQKAVNQALARIGVSQQVLALDTEDTQPAVVARLHLKDDVEYVLARFPWEFARKYAALTLVDGTASDPVNDDWTFSYRKPTDCVFVRRLVRSRGGAVNPTAPPFALGSDTDGDLILTNESSAAIEYTARGLCPAYMGDQLFKEALACKLGASLAPALTRMPEKVKECLEALEATIAKAYEIVRPGNPGAPDTASTVDTSTAALAANLAIANRALVRIGAPTIAATLEQSRQATAVRLIFEEELKATLRDHPWQFATRYRELTVMGGAAAWDDAIVQAWDNARNYAENEAVSSGGTIFYALQDIAADPSAAAPAVDTANWTETEPEDFNADWLRGYRLPTDYVRVRRLVNPATRRSPEDDSPPTWATGSDEVGELLFTDAEQAVAEYTARLENVLAFADAHFRDAFAWRLAASLAPSLAQQEPEGVEQLGRGPDATTLEGKREQVKASKAAMRERMTRYAWAKYQECLDVAQRSNSNEAQPDVTPDAPWISGR